MVLVLIAVRLHRVEGGKRKKEKEEKKILDSISM